MADTLSIGLAGLGNVGAGVYKNLALNGGLLAERTGYRFTVAKAAVRDASKPRDIGIPASQLTEDWRDLVNDPAIQISVELIGGVSEAHDLVKAVRARSASPTRCAPRCRARTCTPSPST